MKQYKPNIMSTVIAGILVIGIIAACIAAGLSLKTASAPYDPEAAVLEI